MTEPPSDDRRAAVLRWVTTALLALAVFLLFVDGSIFSVIAVAALLPVKVSQLVGDLAHRGDPA